MEVARHQCLIYEGCPAKHLRGLASVAIAKLKENHRCLYLNSLPMVEAVGTYLAAAGLDVSHEVKRGALILSSDQDHLTNGRFDVDRMLDMLDAAVRKGLSDGYSGL